MAVDFNRISNSELSKCHAVERRLGSAKFERLVCNAADCPGPRRRICRYDESFWSVSTCDFCGCLSQTTNTRTLVHATEDRRGQREETTKCECCKKHSQTIHSTQRLSPRGRSSTSHQSNSGFDDYYCGSSGGGGGREQLGVVQLQRLWWWQQRWGGCREQLVAGKMAEYEIVCCRTLTYVCICM